MLRFWDALGEGPSQYRPKTVFSPIPSCPPHRLSSLRVIYPNYGGAGSLEHIFWAIYWREVVVLCVVGIWDAAKQFCYFWVSLWGRWEPEWVLPVLWGLSCIFGGADSDFPIWSFPITTTTAILGACVSSWWRGGVGSVLGVARVIWARAGGWLWSCGCSWRLGAGGGRYLDGCSCYYFIAT